MPAALPGNRLENCHPAEATAAGESVGKRLPARRSIARRATGRSQDGLLCGETPGIAGSFVVMTKEPSLYPSSFKNKTCDTQFHYVFSVTSLTFSCGPRKTPLGPAKGSGYQRQHRLFSGETLCTPSSALFFAMAFG